MQGRMETIQVLHMNGGTGGQSYANNSTFQRETINIAKPIVEEAIKDVYCRLFPKNLCISDMGCASGPNTFYAISHIVEAVDCVCRSLGRESPEFLIHLNDLPNNDFNTIFRATAQFKETLGCRVGPLFITGVPGSFYERLFPSQALHFVHSSHSLHWLSRVPEEIDDNKGNIYISTTSPPNVAKAYLMQFSKDFLAFLRCRAVELVDGGCMVFTLVGRRLEDPGAWQSQSVWGVLSNTFNDMVKEGLIEKEKLDSFNVPVYFPSVPELKALVEKQGSFTIKRIGLNNADLNVVDHTLLKNVGLKVSKTVRAGCESLLAIHFGEDIIDEVFTRFTENISDCISKEKRSFYQVTIFLRKRD